MKKLTYNNMLRAIKLIEAKGYDRYTAEQLARNCFDLASDNKNGMPIEWYVDKIMPADEYEAMYYNA